MAYVQNDSGLWIEDSLIAGKEGGEHLNDNFDEIGIRSPKVAVQTTDPGINDDVSAGYKVLSKWLNTTTGELWRCVSETDGAAVWVRSPNLNSDGELTTKILFRQGLAAAIDAVVLDQGEPGWSTDDKAFRIGDASTPGGVKIRNLKILTRTLTTIESTTLYLDHADADVLVLTCTFTNLATSKVFNVNANSPSPYPSNNHHGLKPGSRVGQLLTLILDLHSVHNDSGATTAGITLSLNGFIFTWNSDAFAILGANQRIFSTELDVAGTNADYACHYAIYLVWDGNFWTQASDDTLGSNKGVRSIIGGQYVNAGSYSIAVGERLNIGSSPLYCAVFGANNTARGDYNFIAGLNNSAALSCRHMSIVGANHGSFAMATDAYTFQSGNGTRVRIPGQRAFGADFPSGQGTSQGTDVVLQAFTTNATPTNMSAGGVHYIVQPQQCVNIIYQCIGNISQAVSGSAGAVIYKGSISVIRDNAGTTTLAAADHRDFSDTFGDATGAGMSLTISVDDSTDKLHFQVVGHASRAVNWVCRLTTCDSANIVSTT